MLIENFNARYVKGTVHLHSAEYSNGRIALRLLSEDGEPLCVATTNLPDEIIGDNEVILKGWSENQGVPEELMRTGIVGEPLRYIATGFVTASVHELLVKVPT